MPDQPIVLLSGLGADERLLVLQHLRFPSLIVPRWIEPIPNETLRDYSKRMAATIEPQDNMILGGVSMGGMVALEIAQILKLRGVVLIAACYTPSEIASWVRTVAAVGRVTPAFFGDHIRKFAELGMSAMGVIKRKDLRRADLDTRGLHADLQAVAAKVALVGDFGHGVDVNRAVGAGGNAVL